MSNSDAPMGAFLAYAMTPSLTAETMRQAAQLLRSNEDIKAVTWEDLQVGGRVLIEEIHNAIEAADVLIAEISSLNQNVLYEVGFAIAKRKKIWLLIDGTDENAHKNWKSLGLLSSIGYFDYQGDSELLHDGYIAERPDQDAREPLWDQLAKGFQAQWDPHALFYFPTSLRGDAPRKIDRELTKRKNLVVLRSDEDERGYSPLSYYAEMIEKTSASLIYMLGPQRLRAIVHNARASLLAGIASGLGKPLLILAEETYSPALDYQDLLYKFNSVRNLLAKVNQWLDDVPRQLPAGPRRLEVALQLPLRLGQYVAEDEADSLSEYFVPTAEFQRVVDGQGGTSIFVGRKGTGKTATMLQAAERLQLDKRNLVAVVKPTGYELESLLLVLEQLPGRAESDYFLNGLWEFLLHCEIAAAAVREAEGRPAGIATGSALDILRAHLEDSSIGLDQDLSIRLESVVETLMAELPNLGSNVSEIRNFLNGHLHTNTLRELRRLTSEAIKDKERVALLIDNLDKSWERGADYERLARVIFGLLSAVGKVARDFGREPALKSRVGVTLTVFLRADIFSVVLRHAREPDKIDSLQIRWPDKVLLSRVIEDRYAAVLDKDPSDVWEQLFCRDVRNTSAREYILWRVLPRPRDLVYLCNYSLLTASNNRHEKVQEADILSGEKAYSQFAFEALLVESDPDAGLSDLLFEFAGMNATVSHDQLYDALKGDKRPDFDKLVGTLLRSSFLGIEIDDGVYEYFSDETLERRDRALARRLGDSRGFPARYRIHPAFRPFLEVADDDLGLELADALPLN